jgi:hypothetical protein
MIFALIMVEGGCPWGTRRRRTGVTGTSHRLEMTIRFTIWDHVAKTIGRSAAT